MSSPAATVFTIGHSTRELPVFLEMLRAHGVTRLIDVRTMPRSRKNPQFNQDMLPAALARDDHLALMCAEAVPWRCHRSLIADALTVRGIAVQHIMSEIRANPHRLTPFARVDGLPIRYPEDLQA